MAPIRTPERFGEALYEGLPTDDYTQEERVFTVTVAGSERHDGEAPYTYVLEAHSLVDAWAKALAHHMVEEGDIDAYVVADESFDGEPGPDDTYGWNDLRPVGYSLVA